MNEPDDVSASSDGIAYNPTVKTESNAETEQGTEDEETGDVVD
jgi:hypothetical protein